MIAAALLIMAGAVPQALLERSDGASADYVACLFAASRAAQTRALSADAFERELARSCLAEERAVREAARRVFALRGDRSPQASADALTRETRSKMIDGYRRLPEQQRALEELELLCRQKPEACRP
jgi:hypothetical protein